MGLSPFSVNVRDDAPGDAAAVFGPQVAVARGAASVVVGLARKQKRYVIQRIQPRRDRERIAEAQREAAGHEDFAEVIDVARQAPEAAGQNVLSASADRARIEHAERLRRRILLEPEFL